MARRFRQHTNPLNLAALVPRSPLVIPAGPQVEIELGCGDGLFMVDRARAAVGRLPSTLFIGLDIRRRFLEPGHDRINELALPNVRLEICNLSVDAGHLFPPQRINTFWINFPDPWFKRRQRNRRWLDPEVLEALVDALAPNGRIVYQSDVWDVAIEALGLLEASPMLRNSHGAFSFCRERLAEQRTSREVACEREGKRIWRLEFERNRDDDARSRVSSRR